MSYERSNWIKFHVNGDCREFAIGARPGELPPSETLADTLRERLGLTGTKVGCDRGSCCSCTVLINGVPSLSCMTLTVECDGASVTTIEGLPDPATGELDPLQQAFIDHTAYQCGFCTPGMIIAAKALLTEVSSPTEEEIKVALGGHYCRCISHYHVLDAVADAAGRKR
ncbi:MAG: carbon monoxide dehydrogenase [Deltaproteobacteria bacterium]|nr:MAG: carbon monoxide dehydrogenase [Deltaproteobacteria bacterium]